MITPLAHLSPQARHDRLRACRRKKARQVRSAPSRQSADAAVGRRGTHRRSPLQMAEHPGPHRPRPGHGGGRHRRRRMAGGPASDRQLRPGAPVGGRRSASSSRFSTTSRSAATRSTPASRFSRASSAFRPGPMFWLVLYLLLDWGSLAPYLAMSAASPLMAIFHGKIPDPNDPNIGLYVKIDRQRDLRRAALCRSFSAARSTTRSKSSCRSSW